MSAKNLLKYNVSIVVNVFYSPQVLSTREVALNEAHCPYPKTLQINSAYIYRDYIICPSEMLIILPQLDSFDYILTVCHLIDKCAFYTLTRLVELSGIVG